MTKDSKTKRIEKAQRLRLERTKARANAYFVIYYDMGVERNLKSLADHAGMLGLKISVHTLERYSVKYDWQQRVITEDTRRHEQDLQDADKVRGKMLETHSKIGKTLQSLALAGMLTFQEASKAGGRLTFSAGEIVALAKAGTDLELRAAGEPTLKVEITTVLYNVMIARIALLSHK